MRRLRFSEANFAYLLMGLLLFLLAVPVLRMIFRNGDDEDWMRLAVAGLFSGMLLVGVWSTRSDRRLFRIGIRLVALQMILALGAAIERLRDLELAARFLVLAFCFGSLFLAGRRVFNYRQVDQNTVMGAICIYLLLGLIYALLYSYLAHFAPAHAFNGLGVDGPPSFDDFLYFSFVTLTTTGYGDVTPINPLLRTLAYLEMITGHFYMAILVAGLVSQFMANRGPRD
jgi:hypothetical protein